MKKGYTLIEVLISLTILGIFFGFGYANFRDYSRRKALEGVVEGVKSELRFTQSKAIAGEKPDNPNCQGINILDSYSFVIVDTNTYSIRANCSGGVVSIKDSEVLDEGVSMSSTLATISFKVLGKGTNIPEGETVVITFTQSKTNDTRTLTVTSGGEIK